jgi:hypothetical protein
MVSSMVEVTTLRHPELVSGSIYHHGPVLSARWMLKRVQHDEIGNAAAILTPLRASASPREVAFNGFAQRRGDAEIYI